MISNKIIEKEFLMELVYLWVEKYKNIKKQGFNFSPRFRCDYKDGTLTIHENKDYVSIFPENINITAIVGENGSGKSSIVTEIINKIIFNKKIEYQRNAPLICFLNDKKDEIYIYSDLIKNISKVVSKFNFKITHLDNENIPSEIDNEYKSPENTSMMKISKKFKEEYYRSFFYLYNNSLEKDSNYHHIYEYNKELLFYSEINKSANMINIQKEMDKTLSYLITLLYNQDRIPKEIKNFYLPTKLFLDREILVSYFKGKYEEEELKYHTLLKNDYNKKDIVKLETMLYLRYFIKLFDVLHQEDMKEEIEELFENTNILESYNEIYTILESMANKYIENIQDIKEQIRDDDNKNNDSTIKDLNELERIFQFIVDIDEFVSLIKKSNNNSDPDYEMNLELLREEEAIKLKQLPSYLKVNFANKNGRYFDEISSGEYNLLKLLLSIENIIHLRKDKTGSLYILLDEIENTFHPDWQKRILSWLIEFVKHYSMQINIIVATHSPFLLSDIPKQNIIFLEKDEKTGNCINATNKVDINPFGANIHTLLSHGFFMKDGLMGEFAKEKINQVYNFIVQKDTNFIKTKEEAQNIINLIGEPMLRKELQFLYDEKFEVDEIDKQIREYEEAIEKLKSKKKKND
jgi:predicted ATPase